MEVIAELEEMFLVSECWPFESLRILTTIPRPHYVISYTRTVLPPKD